MSTPIFTQLLTRFASDDHVEIDASTFSAEMRDMAFIMRECNEKSLILVDELGRGTSTADSLAISVAICEHLLACRAITLFATHLHELAHVLQVRPGVACLQLKVTGNDDKLKMHYQVADGTCDQSAYGLKLARVTALPASLLERAQELHSGLTDRQNRHRASSKLGKMMARRKAVLNLKSTLERIVHSQLTDEDLMGFLARVQADFVKRMA
jgi:DNA mismatch repair protein MSH4